MLLRRSSRIGIPAALALVLLPGCPYTCENPVSYTVTEPTLGTRVATLTWLQTGVMTQLSLTTETDPVTTPSCTFDVNVAVTLVSDDGAIDESREIGERVEPDGTLPRQLRINIDAERALAAGVAPELPDLLERRPLLLLTLTREGDTFADGELRATSTSDDVALALVEFGSTP
jgi:hypothetical protein